MNESMTFNLLDEPWILVLRPDGVTEEISLFRLFSQAHEYKRLAGELPTQDVAILRFLLAVLHAVFGRYDLDGNYEPLGSAKGSPPGSPTAALTRWKALWDKGSFPMAIVGDYLAHFKDRFWLFHDTRPFYQVATIRKATDYTAAKLNGELSESGNKIRLFPQRTGRGKHELHHAEAARWLIYVNAFDDTAAKPTSGGLPSPGAGWLGKLGLIVAVGDNLFETLLLNLVLLKDGGNEAWGMEKPTWEADFTKTDERTVIVLPDNPSELLTLQSRRLLLKREKESVVGYALLGGDFFQKENALPEQMTVWRNTTKKATENPEYVPRRHDPTRQLWRDFSVLLSQGAGARRPGIVSWLARLKSEGLLPRMQFSFMTTAVKYGDKDSSVDDLFSDSLAFSANLLTRLGDEWISRIIDQVDITERLVEQVGYLAQCIAKAAGDDNGYGPRNTAMEQAYFNLDNLFREWLEGIEPAHDNENKDKVCNSWWEQAQRIIREHGGELIKNASPQSFIGREIKEKSKGKSVSRIYIAPKAYNYFIYRTSNIDALKGGNIDG